MSKGWALIDSTGNLILRGIKAYILEVKRVLTAPAGSITEEDEVLYEEELRNCEWTGKLKALDLDAVKMTKGNYYMLFNGNENDRVIVYCYENPDNDNQLSVAYNAAQGGGIQPVWDIHELTLVFPMRFFTHVPE